ncbi:MAG: hypothetical protein ABI833_03875 [Acidobacteriota bacterium]
MPRIMTTNATVFCPHGGVGTSIPTMPIWNIEGGIALREGDSGTLTCPFLPPCVGYTLRSMKLNAATIGGVNAILETDFNQTFTGLPLLIADHHHTIDNSTPAPIPNGAEAAALSPELADIVAPLITVVPPGAPFVILTPVPTIPVTFTLNSAFPSKWILTRVSEPPSATHADLTNGDPTGAIVAPAGGDWDTPSLIVTLTLSAAYLTALGTGLHHFYLTGVNRRGLSSVQECIITVS